jgi:hypothetical protein
MQAVRLMTILRRTFMAVPVLLVMVAVQPAHAQGEKYYFQGIETIIGVGGAYKEPVKFPRTAETDKKYTYTYSLECATSGGTKYKVNTVIEGDRASFGMVNEFAAGVLTQNLSGFGSSGEKAIRAACFNNQTPDKNIRIYKDAQTGGIQTNPDGTPAASDATAAETEQEKQLQQCAANSVSLGWIICPVLRAGNEAVTKMLNTLVEPLLSYRALDQNTNEGLRAIWGVMRNLANLGFALIFMVIVFANILSINIDAYTIKRMLPRLVAATVLVQFSFLLCGLVVDIGNVLGGGIQQLIQVAVKSATNIDVGSNPRGWVSAVGGIVAGVASMAIMAAIGLATTALLVVSAVLGLLAMLVTLMLRQLLISVLIVLSPLALAALVLPNTESFFKKWYKTFLNAVMMYPLIMLILSVSGALSVVALNQNVPGPSSKISEILMGALPIFAFFSIPATFKMAGGAIGKVYGSLSGSATGLKSGRIAQGVKEARNEKLQVKYATSGRLGRGWARVGTGNVIPTEASRRKMLGGAAKVQAGRREQYQAELQEEIARNPSFSLKSIALDEKAAPEKREAAIEMMIQKRQYGALSEVKDQLNREGAAGQRVWQNGIRNKLGDVATGAGHLLQSGDAPQRIESYLKTITAEQLAGLHHSSVPEISAHLETLKQEVSHLSGLPSRTAEQAQRLSEVQRMLDQTRKAAEQVEKNPTFAGRIHPVVAGDTARPATATSPATPATGIGGAVGVKILP